MVVFQYDLRAEQWQHIRTTDPLRSVFATVRHLTVRTEGCISHAVAMRMDGQAGDRHQPDLASLDRQEPVAGGHKRCEIYGGVEAADESATINASAPA